MIQRNLWSSPQPSLQTGCSSWGQYCVANRDTQPSIPNWLRAPCHSGSLRGCFFSGMRNRIGWQVIIWRYTLGRWKGPHLWSIWTGDWYVTFSSTYKLANCLIKVMVIKRNVCPGGHGNLFSSTQACGLDIGPHNVKPCSNTIWWRFASIVLNCRTQWGGQRVWNPSAERLGNSEKPFIWLLNHIFLKFCSPHFLFPRFIITYVLANVVSNSVHRHMQPLSRKYYCLSFFWMKLSAFIKWKSYSTWT